jgi:hypothetical protein
MQSLHDMQVFAEQYINDPTEDTPVWLHAKLDNETGERRALVRRIDVQYGASWYGDEATVLDVPLTITVTREPYWESTTARDLPQAGPYSGAAIVYDYTASGASVDAHDIVGDVGARMEKFTILPQALNDDIEKAWIGLRSDAKADTTYFAEIWECEDGVNEAISVDDATSEPNAASPGGGIGVYVYGTPTSSDTWEHYFTIGVPYTGVSSGNVDSLIGTFLWLLRTRILPTNVFEVQFRYGVGGMADADFIRGPIVEVDNDTAWLYKEMGVMPLPIWDIHAYTAWPTNKAILWNHYIQVWAQRTTGAGTIDFDCVCPIPVDEGFLYCENAGADYLTHVTYFDSPKRTKTVLTIDKNTDYSQTIPAFSTQNFILPPGNGRLYCVIEGATDSDITDEFNFNSADNGKYYERWLSLRGSE